MEPAQRGEISSAILVTMNESAGHVGYWGEITTSEDAAAAPGHLQEMQRELEKLLEPDSD